MNPEIRFFSTHARFYGKYSRGFTLIELLVVISILSLLSSIIFSSLGTARSKANTAAGQQFDGQVFRAMGPDAIFVFEMETVPPVDQSPLILGSVPCTGVGAPAAGSGINGSKALSFTPTTYCQFAGTFPYTGLNTQKGAFSFWIYPTAAGTIGYIRDSSGAWFSLSAAGKITNLLGLTSNSTVQLNTWTHVLISWNFAVGGYGRRLYINGKLDSSSPDLTYTFGPVPYWLSFGTSAGGFTGKLDRIILYNVNI